MRILLAVKEKYEKRLFVLPGVVSVGLGYKSVGNKSTGQLAIVVGVVEKLPESKIFMEHIIPRSLDGIPTDVIQAGRIKLKKDRG